MSKLSRAAFLLPFMALLLVGCGSGDRDALDSAALEERRAKAIAAMERHYATQPSLPPDLREAFERGEVTEDEIDAMAAAGELEPFFVFATPDDLPDDLVWEDGSDLPEFASPDAKKGGTWYTAVQDYPRTLRRVGPDANSSFRPFILDTVVMGFGQRHPEDISIVDGNFRYFPGIAEAWSEDKETRTVYVRINPAARWSDGQRITADDLMFMFYFYQSEWISAPWSNNFYSRNYVRAVRYDDLTFSVTLPEAKPDMLGRVLNLEPLPAHFFDEFGPDFVDRYQWRFVPTSGAYVVRDEDVRRGRSIALTRNPDWWAKDLPFWRYRFNYDRVHFSVIRDTAKHFESFRAGEVDGFGLNLPDYYYDRLPDDDDLVARGLIAKYTFYNERPRPTFGFWMNSSRPLLDNRDIRKGIHYASNWERVLREYFRGDYTRMRTTSDGYGEFTHPEIRARDFDVDKALEAFARAGFTERDSEGVLVNDRGQRLAFTLTTGYENLQDILTIMQREALQAGLLFRVEVLDGTAAWKKVQEKQHDIQFVAFNVGPEMYPRFWETYHSVNAYDRAFLADGSPNPDRRPKAQTNNLQLIANRELDALIERYRASESAEEMRALAFEMEEILYEDASFVPGFVMPFYRTAAWRWARWPEHFDVRISGNPLEYWLGWIEPGMREQVLAARRSGERFEPIIEVHDRYRPE
ncbi:MAG: ABC transporter substrate-binding protein [Gammaproteobacteria bacterium]|nr:MAG: ABC transporter substrate-binding protein [Gammaproteobacteria bacterium]